MPAGLGGNRRCSVPESKLYLGDGVYAEFDGYAIVLTTENGIATTNRIVLEPEVFRLFERWVTTLRAQPEGRVFGG